MSGSIQTGHFGQEEWSRAHRCTPSNSSCVCVSAFSWTQEQFLCNQKTYGKDQNPPSHPHCAPGIGPPYSSAEFPEYVRPLRNPHGAGSQLTSDVFNSHYLYHAAKLLREVAAHLDTVWGSSPTRVGVGRMRLLLTRGKKSYAWVFAEADAVSSQNHHWEKPRANQCLPVGRQGRNKR